MIQAFYQALQISVAFGKCIWIHSIQETGKDVYCNTLMQLRKALLRRPLLRLPAELYSLKHLQRVLTVPPGCSELTQLS